MEAFLFSEKMQAKTPQEIYDAAYQIAMKNEIADFFSNADYSPQAAKVLMKSPNLLQDIYEECLGREDSHMDELILSILVDNIKAISMHKMSRQSG